MSLRARLLAGLIALAAVGLVALAAITYAAAARLPASSASTTRRAAPIPARRAARSTSRASSAARPGGDRRRAAAARRGRRPARRAARRRLAAARRLRRAARRDGDGRSSRSSLTYGETAPAAPDLPADMPIGERSPSAPTAVEPALPRRAPRRRAERRGTTIAAVPLADVDEQLDELLLVEAARDRRRAAAASAALGLVGRAARAAPARPHRRDRGRDRRRRPARQRVEPADDRTEVGRLGLSLNAMLGQIEEAFAERAGERGAPAPVPRRRLARAAHAAGVDPRLRRAVPDGRRARRRRTPRRR